MACIDCSTGLFITTDFNWNLVGTVPVTLPNGTVITSGGPSSLSVSKGGVNQIFNAPSGGQVHYYNWGTPANFLAILTVEGGSLGTRTVVIINTGSSGLNTQIIANVLASSSVPLPIINHCAGSGGAILVTASNGTSLSAAIVTSDNGNAVCSVLPFTPTMQVSGNATTSQLQILHGGTVIASAARPAPNCQVSPQTSGKVVFPEAVTGAGVDPTLSTTTKQIIISNNGSNCLQITSIGNSAHFSLIPGSESKPFPVTLQNGENFHFDVRFSPPTVGSETNYDESMSITPTPSTTDSVINCSGKARPPHITISFASLNFGSIPVGSTRTLSLVINNTGEVPVTVNIPAPLAGSSYTWTPPAGAAAIISVGGSLTMSIIFAPATEGNLSRTITFTSNASGSPHSVSLNGSGCVSRPVIQLNSTGPINFNNIQQGFRTVRSFTVRNTGNGTLIFSAKIVAAIPGDSVSESDALQFGLLRDSTTPVTNPLNSFIDHSIAPTSICGSGSIGSGEFIFGVAFFASGSPRTVNAQLQIYNHNDTTSGAPSILMINLSSNVISPVSADVELVIDRSGSMSEPSGSRIKIETARDAAKLFVALSRPDVSDRIGLVRYNTTPELVLVNGNSIQEITAVNHADIGNAINPANFSPALATCIAGGVMVAEKDIDTHPRAVTPAALNKVILVLTDGIDNTPYVNPDNGVTYSLLGGPVMQMTPSFTIVNTTALPVPTDLKIYAIAIGDNIDTGRLGTLATSTGGNFLHTREFSGTDYFNLEKHFTQVYMEAVNYAPIADPVFTINPGETHKFEFEVLNGDKSAMVVIYDKNGLRIPFYIQTPKGETVDLLSVPSGFSIRPGISPTARFIEINMPQGEPDRCTGTWKVILHHDNRACFSNLSSFNEKEGGYLTHSFAAKEPGGFGTGFQPEDCKDNYREPILYGIALGVGSNFNMIPFVTPGIVQVGKPIQLNAMVSEFGLPVKNCKVTVIATRPDGTQTTHKLFDDGDHGDDQSDDGTYGLAYTNTFSQGIYSFLFSCIGYSRDGKPVKREAVRSKYVEGIQTSKVGAEGTGRDDNCCRRLIQLLRILAVIGIIGILLFLYKFFI